ncbi:MAG: N-acetylglucosamine kinase [Chloroflexota bacterium]
MRYFLGIDVGSSKTHALIADEAGRCLGFGKAWGGNYQGVGYDGLAGVLQRSFEQACQAAGVSAGQVAGAGFGVAGYDFPSDREPHLGAIAKLGLSCPVEVVNDGVNGLLAGTSHGVGVNVTAGSGVNCRGLGPDGQEGRIVGNGYTFGEFGGGIEITWKGLHMVNYAWIKRIPPTALTQVYLEATGAKDELDLMEGLSNNTYHLFPFIAVRIFEAAHAGDAAAREILQWAGQELGWLAVSVIRQIGMEKDEVEVVQSGSVFEGGPILTQPMREVILRHVPKARLTRLDGPPVVGPVLLGMKMAGLDGYPLRQTLIQTAKEIVQE